MLKKVVLTNDHWSLVTLIAFGLMDYVGGSIMKSLLQPNLFLAANNLKQTILSTRNFHKMIEP